jgi:hypothetical protein
VSGAPSVPFLRAAKGAFAGRAGGLPSNVAVISDEPRRTVSMSWTRTSS